MFSLLLAASVFLAQAPAALWIDVPFVAQPRNGCGAAALAMVMQYWNGKQKIPLNSDSDVTKIDAALYSPHDHGIPAAAMAQYLEQHRFKVFAFSGRWDDIEEQIGKGRPLIVAVKPQAQNELHYVVIDGFDSAHNLVTMNDPADRKLLNQERARFEKDWSATNNWTLLAVPEAAERQPPSPTAVE